MTLAERLLGREGLILIGLPVTGKTSMLTAAATELSCLGQVVKIPGSQVEPRALAKALELLVSENNAAALLTLAGIAEPTTDVDRLFLVVDDFGCLLRSNVGNRIDLLLGTITFADTNSASIEVFTSACLLRGELGSAEDSMCFTDRAARVYVGQAEAPFLAEPGLERFGGWAGVAHVYRSDRTAGLGRARNELRRELLRKLVGALMFEDVEIVLSVLRRQRDGSPRRWDPDKYIGLAPLVVEDITRAVVPEEFVNTGLPQLLDLGEASASNVNNVQARARWFASRCSDDTSPLWWDGHFGEQGTHPVEFLRFVMSEIGRDRCFRVLVHQNAINDQQRRYDELRAAIQTDPLLANIDVRSTRAGGQQGLHDRQLYLPSLQRVVKLPIYTRLAGPYPPGDYTETWTTSRSRFQEVYGNTDRAFQIAQPL